MSLLVVPMCIHEAMQLQFSIAMEVNAYKFAWVDAFVSCEFFKAYDILLFDVLVWKGIISLSKEKSET